MLAHLFLVLALGISGTFSQVPDVEFRAVFLTTAWNIDWPSSSSSSPATQQAELINYLDLLSAANFNAAHFQVRPAGDAFYASTIEPWSRFLTGTQGTAPTPMWDPLSFAINAAHDRGIEIHAWLNPYRANTAGTFDGLHPSHMANVLRDYAYIYGSSVYMDPGRSAVEDWLVNVIQDIVTRYDVDGIHFDDYFYPYPVTGVEFPDDATYDEYLQNGGTLPKADWRRDNVNRMVERVYGVIKSLKPACVFSISPFGIYRPGHPEGMPPPIAGLDPYTAMFADAKLWLQQGWVDVLAPQIYWAIDPPAQSYPVIVDWWLDQNPMGRHIYPANGLYKIVDNDWPVSEITNQVALTRDPDRRAKLCLGNNFYSSKYFRDNNKGVYDVFRANVYPTPAVTPPIDWLQIGEPSAPSGVQVSGSTISWDAAEHDVYRWLLFTKFKDGSWKLKQMLPSEISSVQVSEGVYALAASNEAKQLSKLITVHV